MAQELARVKIKADDESKEGFASFMRSSQEASRHIDRLTDGVSRFRGMLAGVGITVSAAGFAALIKHSIDAMGAMHELSQRTGVSVETLSGLELVARQSSTSMDEVAKVTQKLSRNMLEFVRDGSSKVGDSFKSIGITQGDVQRGMANMDAFLPGFARKLLDGASGARQVAIAQELMGKSGANALPFLHQLAESEGLVARYSGEAAARADEFLDRVEKLKFESGKLGITLANNLLPWLNDIVAAMIKGQEEGGKFASILRGVQAAAGITNPDLNKYNREQAGLVDALMVTERQRREIETGQKPNRAVGQGMTMLDALKKREAEIRERLNIVQQMLANLQREDDDAAAVQKRPRGAATEEAQNRAAGDDRLKMLEHYRKLDAAGWVKHIDDQIAEYERGLAEEAKLTEQFYKEKEKLQEADQKAMFDLIDAEQEFEIEMGKAMTAEKSWHHLQLEEDEKRIKANAEEAKRFTDDLNRSLTDALLRGFESGETFGRNFFQTLKNMAQSLILRPVLQFVLSPITGALTGGLAGLGIPGVAGASDGGGGAGGALSTLGSLGSIAQTLGAGIGNASTMSGIALGNVFGGSSAAFAVGSAIPYVGLALAALSIGKSLFGSKKTPAVGQGYNISGSIEGGSLASLMAQGITNKGFEAAGSQMGNSVYAGAFSGFGANLEKLLAPVIGADAARGVYSTSASFGFSQGMGVKDPETAVQMVRAASNAIIGQLAPGIREMAQANEELIDTLNRVSTARRNANLDGIFARMNGIVSGTDDVAGLFLSDLSPLTARQRLDRASSLYSSNIAGVRAGDMGAIGDYSSVTRAYASEARSYYASSPDYTAIFDELQANNTDLRMEVLNEQATQFSSLGLTIEDVGEKILDMHKDVVAALERATAASVVAKEAIVQAQHAAAEHIVEAQAETMLLSNGGELSAYIDTGALSNSFERGGD